MKNISLLKKAGLTLSIALLPFATLYASDVPVTAPLPQDETPIVALAPPPRHFIHYTRYSSTPTNMEQSIEILSNKVVSITNGDTPLKEGTDYTLYSPDTHTDFLNISNEYLDKQEDEFVRLRISYTFSINEFVDVRILPGVQHYKLSSLTGTYDKSKATNHVEPWINCSFSELKSITTPDQTLNYQDDYVVYATTDSLGIHFNDSFLKTLPLGNTKVTFTFTKGNPLTYIIKVINEPQKSILVTSPVPSTSNTSSLQNKLTLSVQDDTIYSLDKLKVRYYYTSDSESPENVCIDYADVSYKSAPWYEGITADVKAHLIKMDVPTKTADTYLELSFDNTNVLAQNATLTVSPRIYHTDWSNYDQTNDHSAANTEHVCIYYNNELISGIEP